MESYLIGELVDVSIAVVQSCFIEQVQDNHQTKNSVDKQIFSNKYFYIGEFVAAKTNYSIP